MNHKQSKRAPRNRTIEISANDKKKLLSELFHPETGLTVGKIKNKIIHGDFISMTGKLPGKFVDLLFIDPPYNISKVFNSTSFKKISHHDYELWLDGWLSKVVRLLKPTASIYICGDWLTSSAIFRTGSKYFKVLNRITWEREKGRGSKSNWKNCSEDIWFFTMSDDYKFNADVVKLKRAVLAPYKLDNGEPKDWDENENGKFRSTFSSNFWSDITIPFWSMPENTDHPTQKSEKLLAKIILASSDEGDFVFDPFCGSGTTAVAAKKLGRNYAGVEIDEDYCCIAQKRLNLADSNKDIQGYSDGFFWERNTSLSQKKK